MKQNIERRVGHSSNTIVSRSQFKPILFSTDMVKAIIDGTKTQTRRLMPEWCNDYGSFKIIRDPELCDPKAAEWNQIKPKQYYGLYACFDKGEEHLKCKYDVGNVLWVRETFTIIDWWEDSKAVQIMYEDAKTAVKTLIDYEWAKFENWGDKSERKPSLFLFKSLSRWFLEVTNIEGEKLNSISDNDALAEGIASVYPKGLFGDFERPDRALSQSAKSCYEHLWTKINGKESWEQNPFVWVYHFKLVECPEGFC